MTTDIEALRDIAKERHVHFDVEPEMVIRGSERLKVGFRVRLWAVHRKNARALPGCPKCLALVEELRTIADAIVPPTGRATTVEVEPFWPGLYDSAVVPSADEVALSLRLFHREGLDQPIDGCEERCLKEMRGRLRSLGIPER
jgi:hypothetical protein